MAYKQISPQVVTEGGTGVQSATAYAVLCGGTTATGAFQSIAGVGTAAQVLTSNGAGALPTFQDASGGVAGPVSSTDRAIATWNGTGGDTLFNNSTITISSAGEMVNTAQPAFLAYLGSQDNNVTGDTTNWQLGSSTALTEVFDQNSDFNTNGTFTAPVAGRYFLQGVIYLLGGTSITSCNNLITTSNRTYRVDKPTTTGTFSDVPYSVIADMDAMDTFTMNIVAVDSGGKIDDAFGSTSPFSWMSGALIC